jgi:hypothetical protein
MCRTSETYAIKRRYESHQNKIKYTTETFRVILRQHVIWSTYYVSVMQSYVNNVNTITVIQIQQFNMLTILKS